MSGAGSAAGATHRERSDDEKPWRRPSLQPLSRKRVRLRSSAGSGEGAFRPPDGRNDHGDQPCSIRPALSSWMGPSAELPAAPIPGRNGSPTSSLRATTASLWTWSALQSFAPWGRNCSAIFRCGPTARFAAMSMKETPSARPAEANERISLIH